DTEEHRVKPISSVVLWGSSFSSGASVTRRSHMGDAVKAADATDKNKPGVPEVGTASHIPVHPLYSPSDLADWNYDRDLGYPGEFPYTRGVQATMYRGRLWTMRQYAGMGDAEESNKRYKYLLANGTTGL